MISAISARAPSVAAASRLAGAACALAASAGLVACGTTVSTSSFKGAQHEAAQTIANLQSDASSGEQKKICENDLAAAVVARLGGQKGCEKAIKGQLAEIDNLEVNVQSVAVAASGASATAQARSTYSGKLRTSAVSLLREGGRFKISALQ